VENKGLGLKVEEFREEVGRGGEGDGREICGEGEGDV
jgi:hypothetical protein